MSKNVIITGTSRGIGLELVKIFYENGHNVLALSRNSATVEDLGLENTTCFSCDLTISEDYTKVTEFISSNWKRVDILINNAGFLINKPFSETTADDFRKVYETNVFAPVKMIKQVLPFMSSKSHVVNISSMGGIQGSVKFPGLSAYSSSKAALITLTELLAEEYKEDGPSFNALALGAVQTEMLSEAFPDYKAPISAEQMADYVFEFALEGNKFYNGKVLQVSNSTP
ncbi:MAG: SDR family oxidoreductase [Flavobacteriaceae bacterium]|nr:SDR family oxidoreductase [Flavobacteriaceae bacterium]